MFQVFSKSDERRICQLLFSLSSTPIPQQDTLDYLDWLGLDLYSLPVTKAKIFVVGATRQHRYSQIN